MLNTAFCDIRDKLDAHITGLIGAFPQKDVVAQLTADELKELWDTERQRILQLISNLEGFLKSLEQAAQKQIDILINLAFDNITADEIKQWFDAEKQRLMALITTLEAFLKVIETNASAQIAKQVDFQFKTAPKGDFGLYMDK